MPVGTGTCCCNCEGTLTNFIYHLSILNRATQCLADIRWHGIRLTITKASSPSPDCADFVGDFILFHDSGSIWKRTGRPDGLEITIEFYPSFYADDGNIQRYLPKSIQMTQGAKSLSFSYDDTLLAGAPAQTVDVGSNCDLVCDWNNPQITTYLAPRWFRISSIPSRLDVTVAGVATPAACCPGTFNGTWPLSFVSASNVDDVALLSVWQYLPNPIFASATIGGVVIDTSYAFTGAGGPCFDLFDCVQVAAAIQFSEPLCDPLILSFFCVIDVKDPFNDIWPVRGLVSFFGGCDSTLATLTITEIP